MKNPNAPRRVYVRKGVIHVCFNGRYFGLPVDKSEFSVAHPITAEHLPSDGGRARIKVVQKRKGKSTLTETWRSVDSLG